MTKQMMVIVVLFVYTLIRSLFIEPNALEITRYEIEDNRLQGVRVAFLSDFHLKRRDYKRLDKIVRMTNSQDPDIILLGGDFARGFSEKDTMNFDIMAQKLSLLSAPTYAVLGHHDWSNNGEKIITSLRNNGIRVLENSNIRTSVKKRYLDIIGLADLQMRTPKISQALRRTAQPRIILTHNPEVYFNIIDEVSLIFAGHTHGGQFILPFTTPFFVNSKYGSEFASVVIKKTINKMVITRGLGTTGLPVRLNCKPEILIVDFVREGTAKPIRKRRY